MFKDCSQCLEVTFVYDWSCMDCSTIVMQAVTVSMQTGVTSNHINLKPDISEFN